MPILKLKDVYKININDQGNVYSRLSKYKIYPSGLRETRLNKELKEKEEKAMEEAIPPKVASAKTFKRLYDHGVNYQKVRGQNEVFLF